MARNKAIAMDKSNSSEVDLLREQKGEAEFRLGKAEKKIKKLKINMMADRK